MGHWVLLSFFQLLGAQLLRPAGVDINGPVEDWPVGGPFAIVEALDPLAETV